MIHRADGDSLSGDEFTFTAPLGPIEAGDLRWYLESYYRWTSDVFRDRAIRIEQQLPNWGRQLFAAAFACPEAEPILKPWRRPATASQRRFMIMVDAPATPDQTDTHAEVDPEIAAAQQAATLLLALPWELIHDEQGYLFQGFNGVRVRRRLPDADVVDCLTDRAAPGSPQPSFAAGRAPGSDRHPRRLPRPRPRRRPASRVRRRGRTPIPAGAARLRHSLASDASPL